MQRVKHDLGASVRGLAGDVLLRRRLDEIGVREQQVMHRPEHCGDLVLPAQRAGCCGSGWNDLKKISPAEMAAADGNRRLEM